METDKKTGDEANAALEADDQAVADTDGPADDTAQDVADDASKADHKRLQVSISVRSLLTAGLIVVLVGGLGVLAWLYIGAKSQLDEQAQETADNRRAEQIALEYATAAAAMNYKDIPGWKAKLVAGTSPELSEKLSDAADQMEQILAPLQWDSTARPLAAKVRSKTGGIYVVDAFVSVMTKTVQAPDALQSTATYSVTIDTDQDWTITDVGGIGAAVEGR